MAFSLVAAAAANPPNFDSSFVNYNSSINRNGRVFFFSSSFSSSTLRIAAALSERSSSQSGVVTVMKSRGKTLPNTLILKVVARSQIHLFDQLTSTNYDGYQSDARSQRLQYSVG